MLSLCKGSYKNKERDFTKAYNDRMGSNDFKVRLDIKMHFYDVPVLRQRSCGCTWQEDGPNDL